MSADAVHRRLLPVPTLSALLSAASPHANVAVFEPTDDTFVGHFLLVGHG